MLYKFHQDLLYQSDDEESFGATVMGLYQFKYPFNEKFAYYQQISIQHQKNLKATTKACFFM
jgi:hypothetical protein